MTAGLGFSQSSNTVESKAAGFVRAIDQACDELDLAISNRNITHLHYALSNAIAEHLPNDCGANFHTWAVWGSQKAGVTIRQEDLGSAIQNATSTASLVGCVVGAATGEVIGRQLRWKPNRSRAIGAILGGVSGGWVGKQIAIQSRQKAAELIAAGNRTVLQDIGTQSARFLDLLSKGASAEDRVSFFSGLRPGSTETGGQERLANAFSAYLRAFDSCDSHVRRNAMIEGNCQIVHHEHIRLEPYIQGAMPFIIRRCATQRLMSFDIGERTLSVSEDLPGGHGHTAAGNWTDIEQRMRYIFALFREFHDEPDLFLKPMDVAT